MRVLHIIVHLGTRRGARSFSHPRVCSFWYARNYWVPTRSSFFYLVIFSTSDLYSLISVYIQYVLYKKNEKILFLPGVELWGGFPSRAGTTEQFVETFFFGVELPCFLPSGELDRNEGTLARLNLLFFTSIFFLFFICPSLQIPHADTTISVYITISIESTSHKPARLYIESHHN
jgi:hypothetical protein